MAEILVKIDPKIYFHDFIIEEDKNVIYTTLLKDFYGKLFNINFWKDLTKKLSRWGFETNS